MGTQPHISDTLAANGSDTGRWLEVTPGERFTIRTSSWDTSGDYVMFEFVAEPGNGVPMHIHENEEEHFIIVEGTMRMANGDATLDAIAGTSLTVRKGVPHAWCNLSDSPVRMLVIFTPGRIEELFRSSAGRSAHDLEALAREYGTRFVGPPLAEGLYTRASPRSSVPQPTAQRR